MATTVDTAQFTRAIRALSTLSGKDLGTVMRAETAKILETAVRFTPKADAAKIKEQVTNSTRYDFDNLKSDAGHYYLNKKDGKSWFGDGFPPTWYLINDWRVPDAVWANYNRVLAANVDDYAQTLERRLKEALERRGLTAKTWTQIGAALGQTVKAPGFILKAQIPEGIGTATVSTTEKGVTITGDNASFVLTATRTGQGIINRAINARLKFFETNLKKGAFDALKGRAAAYPHLFREN